MLEGALHQKPAKGSSEWLSAAALGWWKLDHHDAVILGIGARECVFTSAHLKYQAVKVERFENTISDTYHLINRSVQ